jgi:hypothetical protein
MNEFIIVSESVKAYFSAHTSNWQPWLTMS